MGEDVTDDGSSVARVAGPLMSLMMRRMRPKDVRKGEGQLLVAHPERLSDDYLEIVAATTRHNADVWPAYMRWTLQGDAIHPDMLRRIGLPRWPRPACRSRTSGVTATSPYRSRGVVGRPPDRCQLRRGPGCRSPRLARPNRPGGEHHRRDPPCGRGGGHPLGPRPAALASASHRRGTPTR